HWELAMSHSWFLRILLRFRIWLFAYTLTGCTGCLQWEKETFVVVFPKDRNEVNALLVYEGLHVGGKDNKDLENAKNALRSLLADDKVFYLGHNMVPISLEESANASDYDKKCVAHLRKHLSISKGEVFIDKQGQLCATQVVTIRDPGGFVEGLNERIGEY